MLHVLRRLTSRTTRVRSDDTLRASENVLTAERDGRAVLLDLRRELYLGLDEVGTTIWRELAEGSTPAAAAARVAAEYDAPADVVRSDTDTFIHDLLCRGLLVRI